MRYWTLKRWATVMNAQGQTGALISLAAGWVCVAWDKGGHQWMPINRVTIIPF